MSTGFASTEGGPINPVQRKVSPWAATEIGHGPSSASNNNIMKDSYRQEAAATVDFLQGVHHARKLPHLQVNYPDTVQKLSTFQGEVPIVLQDKPESKREVPDSRNKAAEQQTLTEYENFMAESVRKERQDNYCKRVANREAGRLAQVDKIMLGEAPMPTVELFPQGCTHTQILAMTNSLAMPRADIIPPAPKPRKVWKGEGEGWSETPRDVQGNKIV